MPKTQQNNYVNHKPNQKSMVNYFPSLLLLFFYFGSACKGFDNRVWYNSLPSVFLFWILNPFTLLSNNLNVNKKNLRIRDERNVVKTVNTTSKNKEIPAQIKINWRFLLRFQLSNEKPFVFRIQSQLKTNVSQIFRFRYTTSVLGRPALKLNKI